MIQTICCQRLKLSIYVWLLCNVNLLKAEPLKTSHWIPFQRASVNTMPSSLLPEAITQVDALSRDRKHFFIRLYPTICNENIPPMTASIIRQNRALEIIQYLDQIHDTFFDYEIMAIESIDREEESKNQPLCHSRIVVEDQNVSPLVASINNTIDYKDLDFKNLSFDSGLFNLSPESKISLQNIAYLLTHYTESTIKIKGHTDPKGSDLLNYELSKARAYMAYVYLKNYGISKDRIETSYYGKGRLLSQKKREDEHLYYKRLRRTEIFVTHGVDVVKEAVMLIQKSIEEIPEKTSKHFFGNHKFHSFGSHFGIGNWKQNFFLSKFTFPSPSTNSKDEFLEFSGDTIRLNTLDWDIFYTYHFPYFSVDVNLNYSVSSTKNMNNGYGIEATIYEWFLALGIGSFYNFNHTHSVSLFVHYYQGIFGLLEINLINPDDKSIELSIPKKISSKSNLQQKKIVFTPAYHFRASFLRFSLSFPIAYKFFAFKNNQYLKQKNMNGISLNIRLGVEATSI